MSNHNNPALTPNARLLRHHMTKEELHLWLDFLRDLPFIVNRQKAIGPYIVDFYCAQYKLVIELDGSQHYAEEGKASDSERDAYLRGLGIQVLRYSNLDIKQRFQSVCDDILKHTIGLK